MRCTAAVLRVTAVLLSALGCAPPAVPERVPRHTRIERLTYSEFDGARLARRVHAEQLLVVPKRVGLFQISPLSELVLARARIELFEETAPAGAEARATAGRGRPERLALPSLAGARRIAGARFHGVEGVVVRDGEPLARVEAARGSADARSGDLVLHGFRLVHVPTSRTVSADRAVWRMAANEFVVRGEYALEEGGVRSSGRDLRIDPDFRRSAAP